MARGQGEDGIGKCSMPRLDRAKPTIMEIDVFLRVKRSLHRVLSKKEQHNQIYSFKCHFWGLYKQPKFQYILKVNPDFMEWTANRIEEKRVVKGNNKM